MDMVSVFDDCSKVYKDYKRMSMILFQAASTSPFDFIEMSGQVSTPGSAMMNAIDQERYFQAGE